MATLTLSFNGSLNTSVQVGDIGYFVETSNNVLQNVDFDDQYQTNNGANIHLIGPITSIDIINQSQHQITFDIDGYSNIPNLGVTTDLNLNNYFIMFSKDNCVNTSGLTGYYSKARVKNNSPKKAELFRITAKLQTSSQ